MPLADETALGLLETHGLVAGIEAADAMLKTAEVRLVSIERTVPALITIKIVGEVAAVQVSVEAGRSAAERIGRVVSAHVIPRPAVEVRAMMKLEAEPAEPRSGTGDSALSPGRALSPGATGESSGARQPASARQAGTEPEAPGARSPEDRALDELTVPELRAMARELPGFPIRGREVARARKAELIDRIRRYRSG